MSKATPPPKKQVKKTSLSDREYVNLLPNEDDIATKEDGARYLPIDVVERDLDRWAWGTQNFEWREFKDKRGEFWIGASLELVIPWTEDNKTTERRLVGCCNFHMGSYAPNSHYVATAKSECVKNAASDLGRKFGRGLNDAGVVTMPEVIPNLAPLREAKRKPDKDMQERIRKAVEDGDDAALAVYGNIYEINNKENES